MYQQIGARPEPGLLRRAGLEVVTCLADAARLREREIAADRDRGDHVGERSRERGETRGRFEAHAAAQYVFVDGVHLFVAEVARPVANQELVRNGTIHASLPSTQRWSASM